MFLPSRPVPEAFRFLRESAWLKWGSLCRVAPRAAPFFRRAVWPFC